MKWSNAIQCPHCKKEQFDPLTDLVETGDMDGSFKHECENCNEIFVVYFEFRPFNYTQMLQVKEGLADRVKEQQKGIEQLNNFIQFQRDVLDETKMELKGAKEDYSRLLKTAEEITEQHRKEIEKLKKDLQLQKESVAGWARQYQQLQEQMDNALVEIERLKEKGSVYQQPPSK